MHKVNGSEDDGDGGCRRAQHMLETMGSGTFLQATKLPVFLGIWTPPLCDSELSSLRSVTAKVITSLQSFYSGGNHKQYHFVRHTG